MTNDLNLALPDQISLLKTLMKYPQSLMKTKKAVFTNHIMTKSEKLQVLKHRITQINNTFFDSREFRLKKR